MSGRNTIHQDQSGAAGLGAGVGAVSPVFSFARRRYASRGPRRLFVPRQDPLAAVHVQDVERSAALLRVVSNCA